MKMIKMAKRRNKINLRIENANVIKKENLKTK
jgi:hypothetical protein